MAADAVWIWKENKRPADKEMCFFRKEFNLDAIPARCQIKVSADTYYILYLNGNAVSRGPGKGDRYRKYFDILDIEPYLQKGRNVIAAKVVYFGDDYAMAALLEAGPLSRVTSSRGGFFLEETDTDLGISTNTHWQAYSGGGVDFVSCVSAKYTGYMEAVDLNEYPKAFAEIDCSSRGWQLAEKVAGKDHEITGGLVNLWVPEENPLPPQYNKEISPVAVKRSCGDVNWEALIDGKEDLELPAGGPYWVEIDMGELTTAFVGFEIDSMGERTVELTYAESYYKTNKDGSLRKEIRDDEKGSLFVGETDSITLASGYNKYETMFFRTLRFLRIDFGPSQFPIKVKKLSFTETGYPLDVTGEWKSDLPVWQKMWDISLTTLKRCMHETYEDCPYYEQMQYTMDTFLQTVYTYQVSSDDRMARKAIYDFHSTLMPNGLLTCNAPSKFIQIIPGFNLYWIDMLYHHYIYYGDAEFTKRFLSTADAVLGYFARKIDPRDGLVHDVGYWQFIDWVDQWRETRGTPVRNREDVNVIYNMMFVYGLKRAACLNRILGRTGTAEEYEVLAAEVSESIRKHAWSSDKRMFRDVTGVETYSQHSQVWAVLSDIIQGKEAADLMDRSMKDKDLARCSYSMSYYLFRALEKTGLYHLTGTLWETWMELIKLNITTWPEDPVSQRSDCHAWSSLPLYEFAANLLGVQPAAPGYKEIKIAPYTGFMDRAQGKAATLHGPVEVKWEKVPEGLKMQIKLPKALKIRVEYEGSTRIYEDTDLIKTII
jgi:hypothetical protein